MTYAFNSTLKPSRKPMARSAWKPSNSLISKQSAKSRFGISQRSREKREPGLAQRVAQMVGTAIEHNKGESSLLRSEEHRKNIKALPCVVCGKPGPSDPAHANATKGFGIKVCDSLLFPACREHHRAHDQGAIYTKLERWKKEWEYVDKARAALIQQNKWPAHVEAAYQLAIRPLARVVHPEEQ